jgi:hypothetical protein
VGLDVVAEFLDLKLRKLLVEALDFLEAENVWLNLLQIGEEMGKPLADGIDVPGGDAQAAGSLFCAWRQSATLRPTRAGVAIDCARRQGAMTMRE